MRDKWRSELKKATRPVLHLAIAMARWGSWKITNGILHFFMKKIQIDHPTMKHPSDYIGANYSFNRTFHRTAKGRARAANLGLGLGVKNAMNRWRKIEEAKGKHPQFNMVEHCSPMPGY